MLPNSGSNPRMLLMQDDFFTSFPEVAVGSLLDAIPHAIAVVDRELRVVAINEFLEALTGLSLADVRGVYVDFVLRSNIAQRGRTFREVFDGGEPLVIEGDIISRDRRKLPMQFTLSPLRGGEDQTVGLVIVIDNLATVASATGLGSDQEIGESIIGQSPKMREVFDLIPLMAHTEASVLITGETGTGKDKIAEAIHKRSSRASKPFIKINCGALPESLLESELFG